MNFVRPDPSADPIPALFNRSLATVLLGVTPAGLKRLMRNHAITPTGWRAPRVQRVEIEKHLGRALTLADLATAQAAVKQRRNRYRVKRLPLEGIGSGDGQA